MTVFIKARRDKWAVYNGKGAIMHIGATKEACEAWARLYGLNILNPADL